MKVIIQLRSSGAAHQAATRGIAAPSVTSGLESAVSGISIDPQYPPVQLPGVQTTTGAVDLVTSGDGNEVLMRLGFPGIYGHFR